MPVTESKRPARRPNGPRVPVRQRMLRVGLLFLMSALAINALVGARGLPAVLQARKDYQVVAADLDRIRQENEALRADVKRLREDPAAIEELARRDLNLIHPGEVVFIIRDVPPPDSRK